MADGLQSRFAPNAAFTQNNPPWHISIAPAPYLSSRGKCTSSLRSVDLPSITSNERRKLQTKRFPRGHRSDINVNLHLK